MKQKPKAEDRTLNSNSGLLSRLLCCSDSGGYLGFLEPNRYQYTLTHLSRLSLQHLLGFKVCLYFCSTWSSLRMQERNGRGGFSAKRAIARAGLSSHPHLGRTLLAASKQRHRLLVPNHQERTSIATGVVVHCTIMSTPAATCLVLVQ